MSAHGRSPFALVVLLVLASSAHAAAPPPSITPSALAVGESAHCSPATFAGGFSVRWLRDGAPIADATSISYTTTAADGGRALACEVTSPDGVATSAPATVHGAA